jgi:hypothetical protein
VLQGDTELNHGLKTFCLLALCLITGQGRILGQTPLLSESFENAATVTNTQLNDAYPKQPDSGVGLVAPHPGKLS